MKSEHASQTWPTEHVFVLKAHKQTPVSIKERKQQKNTRLIFLLALFVFFRKAYHSILIVYNHRDDLSCWFFFFVNATKE